MLGHAGLKVPFVILGAEHGFASYFAQLLQGMVNIFDILCSAMQQLKQHEQDCQEMLSWICTCE